VPHANYAPLFSFAITLVVIWWLVRSRMAQIAIDRPNERSLHANPVPRTGGLGLHAGIFLLCPFIAAGLPAVMWAACLALLMVSFIDDVQGLPVAVRLASHLAAGGLFAATMILPHYGLFFAGIITLGIAWTINLYNFMDGADGLAGGMTLFGFGFYGIAAWLAGDAGFALTNFSIAASAAAFLLFNFYPGRIFMGDAGAVPLGFLAGSLGIFGWLQQDWPWWFPLLVFSPFIVDTTATLARRLFGGARIWKAHRDHYYQRLVRMGWGHRHTVLAEYALMALCGSAALAALHWPHLWQSILLLAATLLYAAIIGFVEFAWRGYRAEHGNEA
jgi:UDP-N-acetylmuramyl pentapeptide phosphotransferase/UDP-N-acetylglucosamine-1-phosphate transferase